LTRQKIAPGENHAEHATRLHNQIQMIDQITDLGPFLLGASDSLVLPPILQYFFDFPDDIQLRLLKGVILNKQINYLAILLKEGLQLHEIGQELLLYALSFGDIEIISLLLSSDITYESKLLAFRAILYFPAKIPHLFEMMRQFIDQRNRFPSLYFELCAHVALYVAVSFEDLDSVNTILSTDNVTFFQFDPWLPCILHTAIRYNYLDIAQSLIKHANQDDLEYVDETGYIPIQPEGTGSIV
jgi:hypothetical protein